jgi:hypothetical protein
MVPEMRFTAKDRNVRLDIPDKKVGIELPVKSFSLTLRYSNLWSLDKKLGRVPVILFELMSK